MNTKPSNIPKIRRPETIREAQTWETVKNRYLYAGLCIRCASQCAWGHQLGFSNLNHEPCDTCTNIILPPELIEKHGPRGQRWLNKIKGNKPEDEVDDLGSEDAQPPPVD